MSFKERAELSLIPSKVRRHANHIVKANNRNGINALKAAVIYGANASGKSNLIKAIWHAQQMIVMGSKSGRKIAFHPFKLNSECLIIPSRFEFEIKLNEQCYAYGFIADNTEIKEEWLYRIDKVKDELVFERKANQYDEFTFGKLDFANKQDKLFLDFTAKGTPDNRLFLNECKERNINKELSYLTDIIDVSNWFEHGLTIIFPDSKYTGLEMEMQNNQKANAMFSKLLHSFDTGISDLRLQEVDFNSELVGIPEDLKQKITEELEENTNLLLAVPKSVRYQFCKKTTGEIKAYKLMTTHINIDGEEILFELNQESDGTQRLLDIAPGIIEIFAHDRTYIIDEIDRSLHPDITTSIFKAFLNNTPDIKSQLIVTTHETNLLNQDILRKDELWFVQKNKEGQSSLYSLEEYQTRFDNDIRRGYLTGRFGGLPLLTEFNNLSWLNKHG
jgi:AAA15 family ATPase/GTPase